LGGRRLDHSLPGQLLPKSIHVQRAVCAVQRKTAHIDRTESSNSGPQRAGERMA
jgi:hypothetical protein